MGQCLAPSLVILILILVLVLTAGASFVVKFESAERSVSCVVSLHDVMRCAVLSSFGCSLRTEQPPPPKSAVYLLIYQGTYATEVTTSRVFHANTKKASRSKGAHPTYWYLI